MKVRKINLKDMSSYVIQQMEAEVKEVATVCKTSCIERYYAITGNAKAYYILMQNNSTWLTLEQCLHNKNKAEMLDNLRIMKLVANAMQEISSCGSKYHHGHLHPGNILVWEFYKD